MKACFLVTSQFQALASRRIEDATLRQMPYFWPGFGVELESLEFGFVVCLFGLVVELLWISFWICCAS